MQKINYILERSKPPTLVCFSHEAGKNWIYFKPDFINLKHQTPTFPSYIELKCNLQSRWEQLIYKGNKIETFNF